VLLLHGLHQTDLERLAHRLEIDVLLACDLSQGFLDFVVHRSSAFRSAPLRPRGGRAPRLRSSGVTEFGHSSASRCALAMVSNGSDSSSPSSSLSATIVPVASRISPVIALLPSTGTRVTTRTRRPTKYSYSAGLRRGRSRPGEDTSST